jgi:transcriptional regulator with XRE-family HTH domain
MPEAVRSNINTALSAQRMTAANLAKSLEITDGQLSKVLNGRHGLSLSMAKRIADSLGMSLGELFADRGIDDNPVHDMPTFLGWFNKEIESFRLRVLFQVEAIQAREPEIMRRVGDTIRTSANRVPGEAAKVAAKRTAEEHLARRHGRQSAPDDDPGRPSRRPGK